MSISVVIGIFGDKEKWTKLAQRAMTSVVHQTSLQPVDARIVHADSLAEARNEGARMAEGDMLVFLDADDQLDPGYLEAMDEARESLPGGEALFQPATLGVYPDGREDPEPVLIPRRPLDTGNFMVIGTMVSKQLFEKVGGFDDSLPIWEDWDLWIRCHQAGAGFVTVPDAVYRVSVNEKSRNSSVQERQAQLKWFNVIRNRYF